jgi:hypothetical protein
VEIEPGIACAVHQLLNLYFYGGSVISWARYSVVLQLSQKALAGETAGFVLMDCPTAASGGAKCETKACRVHTVGRSHGREFIIPTIRAPYG